MNGRSILVAIGADEGSATSCVEQATGLASELGATVFVLRLGDREPVIARTAHPLTKASMGPRSYAASPSIEPLPWRTADKANAASRSLTAAITNAAERLRPLVIVAGTCALDAPLVANKTLVPVLIWRESYGTSAIVAATDLGHPLYPVLRCGHDLAAWFRAPIIALHNVTQVGGVSFPITAYGVEVATELTLKDRRIVLALVLGRLGIRGRSVVTHHFSTASAILDVARSVGARVVVVGTRQRPWWQRLVGRDLASRVLDQADLSVAVVPLRS